MRKPTAVLAIGKSGQMGLDGRLPWHDSADLRRFVQTTKGGVLIAGTATHASMQHLTTGGTNRLPYDRILTMAYKHIPISEQIEVLTEVYPRRPLFVIGGAKTLTRWAPYVGRWDISVVDYDGPADTWFDYEWLTLGGRYDEGNCS